MSPLTITECGQCGQPVRRLGVPDTAVLCPNCLAGGDEAVRDAVRAAAAERLERRLTRFDQAGGFDTAALSAAPSTKWEKLAATAVDDHRQRLVAGTAGRTGLMFLGPTGIGKTRALVAVGRAVGAIDPAGVVACTESELLAPSVTPWELPTHIARMIAGRHCVLVDEIGSVARPRDQIMAAWREVVEHFHACEVPVLFVGTTNRQSWSERDGLADWMGSQTVSRLRGFCQTATTGWTDHRVGRDHEQWRSALTAAPASSGGGASSGPW